MTVKCLIAHFFRIALEEVESLSITFYWELCNQAINIGNIYRQGNYELESITEKQKRAKIEYRRYKAEVE